MALSANSEMKVTVDDPRLGEDGEATQTGSGGSTLKVLGILVGLTVILGGIWLGFGDRLMAMVAGQSGETPVIKANPAPIKVRPENPGGMNVPNQGRLVYGVVDGTASQPRVERLLPSPEKPVAVDQVLKRSVPETNDVVVGTAPRGTADPSPSAPRRLTPTETNTAPKPLTPVPSAEEVAKLTAPAPAPEPTRGSETLQAPTSTTPDPVAAVPAPPPVPSAPATTVASPQPTAPATQQVARATPAPEAPVTDLAKSYRIQLAASRTNGAVESEWDRLRRRHVDLLGDLRLQVTKVDLGATKGIFYRLRAGPLATETAAKTLCERLKQRKLGCLVVKPGS